MKLEKNLALEMRFYLFCIGLWNSTYIMTTCHTYKPWVFNITEYNH